MCFLKWHCSCFTIRDLAMEMHLKEKLSLNILKAQNRKCEDACRSACHHLVAPEAQATLNHALFFSLLTKYQQKCISSVLLAVM